MAGTTKELQSEDSHLLFETLLYDSELMKSQMSAITVANIIEEGRLGGPQNRIAEVARRLHVDDVDTIVFLPADESEVFQMKLDRYRVRRVVIPLRKLTRSLVAVVRYLVFFPFEIYCLRREFRERCVDIVHCSGGAWQYKGVVAGRLAGAKTVWHLNDTGMNRVVRIIFRSLATVCADAIIVSADRVRAYYANSMNLDKPVFEIQAPVDTAHFSRAATADWLPSCEKGGIYLVSVGNMNPLKGYEYLMEAVHLLVARGYRIRLDVIGAVFNSQQAYFNRVKAAADAVGDGVVRFVGATDDVRPYLAAADIYVCASIKEASPLSVWEAMSMEVPVVSTDVGDVPRFIEDGVSGRIVPVADALALKNALVELIDDPEKRRRFAQLARATVVRELDIAVIARRHLECYRAVLGLPVSES